MQIFKCPPLLKNEEKLLREVGVLDERLLLPELPEAGALFLFL